HAQWSERDPQLLHQRQSLPRCQRFQHPCYGDPGLSPAGQRSPLGPPSEASRQRAQAVSLERQKHSQRQRCSAWVSSVYLSFLLVLCTAPSAAGDCVDASGLTSAVVSITRNFDSEEKEASKGILAIRGTAWFLSATSIVTADHVAEAMKLSREA